MGRGPGLGPDGCGALLRTLSGEGPSRFRGLRRVGSMYRDAPEKPTAEGRPRAEPGTTHEGVDAMGRGRQKAKQTKVARELKYYSPETDYAKLQRELGAGGSSPARTEPSVPADDVGDDDPYDDWARRSG